MREEEVKDPKRGAWLVSESLQQGDEHGRALRSWGGAQHRWHKASTLLMSLSFSGTYLCYLSEIHLCLMLPYHLAD